MIDLTVDGRKFRCPPAPRVFDAARLHDIEIPTLCHQQNEKPVGVCRMCVVDVGARVLTASCVRPAEQGMVVKTTSEPGRSARTHAARTADVRPSPAPAPANTSLAIANSKSWPSNDGVAQSRFAPLCTLRGVDDSSMSIARRSRRLHPAAIAASAAAMRFAKTLSSDAWAKANPPASLSTTTCRWAIRPAFPVANAWFPAPPARSLINSSRQTAIAATPDSQPVSLQELNDCPFSRSLRDFPQLNRSAVVTASFQTRRNHLPRRRIRVDRILHSRRRSSCFHRQPHRPCENQRRREAFSRQTLQQADAQRDEDRREEETDQRCDSHRCAAWICTTKIRSRSSAPATFSAK